MSSLKKQLLDFKIYGLTGNIVYQLYYAIYTTVIDHEVCVLLILMRYNCLIYLFDRYTTQFWLTIYI